MAYAAVISLKLTIERLLNSSRTSSIVRCSSPEIMEFMYEEVRSLEEVLEELDKSRISSINMERMNTLDGQIKDVVYELEDVIESHVSNQFLSQNEERSLGGDNGADPFVISINLKELKQDFDSLIETVKKMKEEYIQELSNPLPEEVVQSSNVGGNKSKMVGFSRYFSEIHAHLTQGTSSTKRVVLIGMAGIGKTTLAKAMFEDKSIVDHFECRVWVTVGPKYQHTKILRSILTEVNPDTDEMVDDELGEYLSKSLKNRTCLVVLDDLWNSHLLNDLLRLLPDRGNGNRVLVTSRISKVDEGGYGSWGYSCKMSFMNKEESWRLLRHSVFGEMPCPSHLEKAGKKIAENCESLPLTIVTVGKLLSEGDRTTEYWNEVADRKQHSVFLNAYDEMFEVLLPSYYYLPQYLKAFFLYMGILPQNYGIPLSKLINLWKAEGFLEPNPPSTDFEQFVKNCLDELISRNVVIFRRKMYFFGPFATSLKFEKYYLHSAFLYMCVKEAGKIKFYRVLNSYAEDAEESMKSQRRLCTHNNVLFGIKDFYDSMASVSTARSLLCTGQYHQYPVPICLEYLMLLRVLDALTIRFYEFPIEALKLIQLRYFAITFDRNLPTSISKLLNPKFLIIHRYLSIEKSSEDSPYLPMEIWDMRELEHLHVVGNDLPDPYQEEYLLPNLLTLLDVSPKSCTQRVLERIPNLKKLGIRIISQIDAHEPFTCFDNISQLNGLETLKCTITNPIFRSEVVVHARFLIFPECLKKICLSGLGYPWEEMSKIASLPNLQVLKLRCCAFRGPKWETQGEEFPSLEYLLIEDSDLVVWIIGDNSFNLLGHLIIRHCYKLNEIRGNFLNCIRKTEVVDCDPLAAYYAQQISFYDIHVHSSWEDKCMKEY